MSITSQPLGVQPVHIPLQYSVSVSIPSVAGETLKNIIATVTNLDTAESFTIRQSFSSVIDDTINITGTGTLNLSALGKTFFCTDIKPEAFGVLGGEYNNINTLSLRNMGVYIKYEKVNTEGILEDIGVTDNAIDIELVNAALDICEAQNLDNYITAASNRCFLTNRPETLSICNDDNDFLQYYTTGINAFQVSIYSDPDSIVPRAEDNFNDAPIISGGLIASVGAGPVNINDVSTWNGGGVTVLHTDHRYTFCAGFFDTILLTFTPVTKKMTFIIKDCCEDVKCTLFFMNRKGGVDRYSFDNVKVKRDSPSSGFYEKVKRELFDKSDYGRQKYDSKDKTLLTLESNNICTEVANWLRELQTSTRVYKQVEEDSCISVVVRDSESIIEDRRAPLITKALTIEYSIDPCIQNNI